MRVTRLIADVNLPLEVLKSRLILGILLIHLIDEQGLGFSFDVNLPFERQQMYLDTTKQSFLWLHQKLTSLLEPIEVIANTDIQAWYRDWHPISCQVSPPQSFRQHRPAHLQLDKSETPSQPIQRVTHSPNYSMIPVRTDRQNNASSPKRSAGLTLGLKSPSSPKRYAQSGARGYQ